jgi:hypothetical protein
MKSVSLLRGTFKIAATASVCALMYVQFLTVPVLSVLSKEAWSAIGLVATVAIGGLSRLWIGNAVVAVLTAIGGILAGSLWVVTYFGQHDTAASSSWSSLLRNAIVGAGWFYNIAALVAVVAGWHVANALATRRPNKTLQPTSGA